MTYKITEYTKKKAKQLNIDIKPSSNKHKKLDVYKDNKKIASIGSIKNFDYPTYIETKGLDYANKRRELYYKRHKSNKEGVNGYYAKKLLW